MTHHPSFGAVLKVDYAGGTGYTAIGQVQDIAGPNITRGTVDVTDHDSTSGYREYLAGLSDAGDLTFTIGWSPVDAAHGTAAGTGILSDFLDEQCTMTTWQLAMNICTGTAIWTFPGFLTGFSPSYPTEGQNTADVSVKLSGVPTLTMS